MTFDASTVQAIMDEVWTAPVRKHARLELLQDERGYLVVALRYQGDVVLYSAHRVRSGLFAEPRRFVGDLDRAISRCLDRLRPLTVSEAIEAAERRRFYTDWQWRARH